MGTKLLTHSKVRGTEPSSQCEINRQTTLGSILLSISA